MTAIAGIPTLAAMTDTRDGAFFEQKSDSPPAMLPYLGESTRQRGGATEHPIDHVRQQRCLQR